MGLLLIVTKKSTDPGGNPSPTKTLTFSQLNTFVFWADDLPKLINPISVSTGMRQSMQRRTSIPHLFEEMLLSLATKHRAVIINTCTKLVMLTGRTVLWLKIVLCTQRIRDTPGEEEDQFGLFYLKVLALERWVQNLTVWCAGCGNPKLRTKGPMFKMCHFNVHGLFAGLLCIILLVAVCWTANDSRSSLCATTSTGNTPAH